jgi:membrane-bound metal-dependent hydrolase YbcI (DUF457 family)
VYVGHLAAGLVLKARVREAPLSWLLVATVMPDLLCGVLLLLGVENVVVHGSLMFAHLEPAIGYSHSLLGSIGYALFAGCVGAMCWRSARVGAALALAVFSHFVLDVLSHRPDMPLRGFGASGDVLLGTGLAAYPLAFFVVELLWCLGALYVFDARNRRLLVTIVVLMAAWACSIFGLVEPPPPSAAGLGLTMIATFASTTAVTFWAARRTTWAR